MNNKNKQQPRGYKTIPYLYDYKTRGIPAIKPPKVIPMKRKSTSTPSTCAAHDAWDIPRSANDTSTSTCKCKRDTND